MTDVDDLPIENPNFRQIMHDVLDHIDYLKHYRAQSRIKLQNKPFTALVRNYWFKQNIMDIDYITRKERRLGKKII